MVVLGIDTSCDDTCAAVLAEKWEIRSNVVSSQDEVHGPYGGVVPELASRKHVENIIPIIDYALCSAGVSLSDVDLIAVTQGPGLVGSLVVGISAAKAIGLGRGIPLVGVNHLEGHIAASFLVPEPPRHPFVSLVVSGGHTSLYVTRDPGDYTLVGQTLDDAAGEAFDKVAKLLGLGYPGGRAIEAAAHGCHEMPVEFVRPYLKKGTFDFSFSGLKTAVRNFAAKEGVIDGGLARRIAKGFQETIVSTLVEKTIALALKESVETVVVVGGVAANERLRQEMDKKAAEHGIRALFPPKNLCTDNAAMIAAVGKARADRATMDNLDMNAVSRWAI
jgi:N6-L-threonylcarbamoyladenine synthase